MTRLPHSFPETVRNRGYGTVDRNSQIIIKHDRDLVLVNFDEETDELRVDCDALPSATFRQEAESVCHEETSLCVSLCIQEMDGQRDSGGHWIST